MGRIVAWLKANRMLCINDFIELKILAVVNRLMLHKAFFANLSQLAESLQK